jgi:hypothetical protein
MRHVFSLVIGAGLALCASAAAVPGHAQCATACSSSAACNGTGRGSCQVFCDQGTCSCTDTACGTQIRPVSLERDGGASTRLVAGRAPGDVYSAALVVDCRGNVLEVRLTGADGQDRLQGLPSIRIQSPRAPTPARVAVRE